MKKEYDFSKAKRVDPSRVDPSPKIMISLRLDPHVISLLRDEADALGVGYQTHIGDILRKHVEPKNQSFEEKLVKRILSQLEDAGVPVKKAKSKKKKSA
jgi:hypothetical protein